MEELLLDTLFAPQKLDVVDQKYIVGAILPPEPVDPLAVPVPDRVDEIVRELFGGNVLNFHVRERYLDVAPDSLEKVGLS